MVVLSSFHETHTRQQWRKELEKAAECGKKQAVILSTCSLLPYKGRVFLSWAWEGRVFHADGPSHSAPSVPSILSPFPSWRTHSPGHPSPFLRNFSPGQRKGRFCSFQSWGRERQHSLCIPCTSSLPSWTFPFTPTVLYLTHLHPPPETCSAVEACWPPGGGPKTRSSWEWTALGVALSWWWVGVSG